MRTDRAASREKVIVDEAKEAERKAKFQQRFGYAPGSFPSLPDFRMPKVRKVAMYPSASELRDPDCYCFVLKNSTLEDRLEKLDKQCLRKLEADAKGIRLKKVLAMRLLHLLRTRIRGFHGFTSSSGE